MIVVWWAFQTALFCALFACGWHGCRALRRRFRSLPHRFWGDDES